MKTQMTVQDWIALFREVGLNDEQMKRWHQLFEERHPESHQGFLEWLGLPADECKRIRQQSR